MMKILPRQKLIISFFALLGISYTDEDNCRSLQYDLPMSGRLENHLIEVKFVETESSCLIKCFIENKCVSYNFRQTPEQGSHLHVCEINNANKEQHPSDFKEQNDFVYRGSTNPCQSNPCVQKATCQTGFGSAGYRCICNTGYTGEACNQDIDECAANPKPCHTNANCANTAGSFTCNCTKGYAGNGRKECQDIDECATNPCEASSVCKNTPGSYTCGNEYDLFSPVSSTTNNAVSWNVTSPLQEFTVCLWMRSTDKTLDGTPFSYAVPQQLNEIILFDYKNFGFWLDSKTQKSKTVSANDGMWHHICVTWENTVGSWALYKDGIIGDMGIGFNVGHVVPAGGAFVLAQEQDLVGGGFNAKQSFIGSLTGVNVWDHVIPSEDISQMSKACTAVDGNLIKWSDFRSGVKGGMQVIKPSTCQL